MPAKNAPKNPLADNPKANIRLAHTLKDSPERALYVADYDDWYPALAYVRADGVEYELPVTGEDENSELVADTATQRAGWFDDYADRIVRICPNYVLITEKGEK